MNIVDLLLIGIVLLNLFLGYQKGLIAGTLQLLMFAGGLTFAILTYQAIASFLNKHMPALGISAVTLSFVIALLVGRIILSYVGGALLSAIPPSVSANKVNKVFGVLPGAVNGALWALTLIVFLVALSFYNDMPSLTQESKIAAKAADKTGLIEEEILPFVEKVFKAPVTEMKARDTAEKSVGLRFRVEDPKIREDLEAKMLVLVNQERQKAGLKPLKFDAEMLFVARAHSKDMFARGFFSHETPDGFSPFDRMKKAKVKFLAAGENLALGPTLSICHNGLMNSPGHRANILSKAFGRVGIGVLDGGIYGLMITQNFRN